MHKGGHNHVYVIVKPTSTEEYGFSNEYCYPYVQKLEVMAITRKLISLRGLISCSQQISGIYIYIYMIEVRVCYDRSDYRYFQ